MPSMRRALAMLLLLLVFLSATPGLTVARPRPRYPVVFVPGLAGSELYNGNQLVWVNLGQELRLRVPILRQLARRGIDTLALKPDGQTPASPSYRIRVGGLLRPGPTGFYAGWIDAMDVYGYRRNRNLFIHTYDWRKSIRDAADGLEPVVAEALRRTGSDKVILVGHSMGGAVAREYIVRTGGRNVVGFVAAGTPWLGAPIAWKVLQRGENFGIRLEGTPVSIKLDPVLKRLGQNFPSLYELLPGRHYHAVYRGYVWRNGAPLSYDQAIQQAIRPHNPILAGRASYADSLMTGLHYGVRQYLLAGYGMRTMVGADYGPGVWKERTGDGDEFVPLASADLGANYDPSRPAVFLGPVQEVAYVRGTHNWLMGHAVTQRQIRDWLRQVDQGARLRQGPAAIHWHR